MTEDQLEQEALGWLASVGYTPLNARGDILHEQAQYWGQRGVHYHQFLRAGENTLNLQLARVLMESLTARGGYDAEDYLQRYLDFMLTPGRHRDTYVEECHRKFFTACARGHCDGAPNTLRRSPLMTKSYGPERPTTPATAPDPTPCARR